MTDQTSTEWEEPVEDLYREVMPDDDIWSDSDEVSAR